MDREEMSGKLALYTIKVILSKNCWYSSHHVQERQEQMSLKALKKGAIDSAQSKILLETTGAALVAPKKTLLHRKVEILKY